MKLFADPAYARMAVETIYGTQQKYPFFLYGFVMMPDHCHFLMHVPEGGSISKIMHAYKRSVCFEVGKACWQSRFHLKIPSNAAAALQYIHENPVRRGLCDLQSEYPWSSASGRWDVMQLEYM